MCVFITDVEKQPILVQWLKWLLYVPGPLPVEKIMIDCSQTKIAALREVFGESISILLCHWHIKRAWENQLKTDVKVVGSTMESVQARASIRSMLNCLMYASEEDEYDSMFASFQEKYHKNWHNRRQLWAHPWQKEAIFHTNNLIESYHNQLKSNYFGRSRNTRVDRIIYILSHVVIVDYRQEALQMQIGSKKFYLSPQEKQRQEKVNEIDIEKAVYIITETDNNVRIHINTFLMVLLMLILPFLNSPLFVNHLQTMTPNILFLALIIIFLVVLVLIMVYFVNISSLCLV